MAKTDSFGRPYYETAEEYNQAHRKARANGTYGQVQEEKRAYTHATGRGTKKTYTQTNQKSTRSMVAVMGLGVGIVIIAIISIMMMNITDNTGIQEDTWYEENYVDGVDRFYEQIGVDDVPLAEGFDTVAYKGVAYTIPMTYEEFVLLDVPLSVYPSSNQEIYAGDWENLDMEDDEGNIIGYVRVENETEDDIPLGKCQVKYIFFSSEAAYTGDMGTVPDVTFLNGLDMTCNYEDIENYLGIPTYKYTDEDSEGNIYESYQWDYYGEERYDSFSATFWNGILLDFGITVDEYNY